ncbi:hypothetical protein [Staphylococcus aureus]|uniref:hypothetical protein n=1 Tax=Staphylococcus aureus TaxID=1280 RepID=UPI00190AFD1D|nr:hypothetical protein [Staphylococcus aureus]MBK3976008.1 hypothetical protein [Staphylococcus aureus]
MNKRKKLVLGIPLNIIIRFILAFTVLGIGAYIVKFHVGSEIYSLILSSIFAVVIMLIGIPKDYWKEILNK